MTSTDEIFDIVIVGCGPAGMAAAIGLQAVSQLKFIVLEARNRVGGRVSTDTTTFGINTPIDLGAQWLHHYRPENPLRPFIKNVQQQQLHRIQQFNLSGIALTATSNLLEQQY
ncbi:unnamed protein product [Rotaria sp. Silwood1]|nr:unnamed protein product [Rotaria sp. Silwood1]